VLVGAMTAAPAVPPAAVTTPISGISYHVISFSLSDGNRKFALHDQTIRTLQQKYRLRLCS